MQYKNVKKFKQLNVDTSLSRSYVSVVCPGIEYLGGSLLT
jgi:hypothetical protein